MNQTFTPSYLLLQQEGHLISTCLSLGLTELRNANVHNKGAFYSSLFNLSIGCERLLKSIVIIDHMLKNSLSVPRKKQLKGYGHNVIELYDTCVDIGNLRNSPIKSRSELEQIDQELLSLLSDFARITRYHNLDALSASQVGDDPLEHWGKIILAVLEADVSKRQREKILLQASVIANSINDITITIMHGLDQKPLTTAEALSLPGLHDQAVKYIVLRLVKILCNIRELLSVLCYEAYTLGVSTPPFPQMQEFLQWLWDDRKYVLRKKKWP